MVKKMKEGDIVSRGGYRYQERGGKQYNFNITEPEKKKTAPVKPKAAKPEVKMPKRPVNPTPYDKPDVSPASPKVKVPGVPPVIQGRGPLPPEMLRKERAEKESAIRSLRSVGRGIGPYRDDGYNMYPRDVAMKGGGKVRGDGMARVKTKGRCL